MTELGGGFYTRPDDPPEVIATTAGRASSLCTLAILDPEGKPLPSGEDGDLVIKSPFAIKVTSTTPMRTGKALRPTAGSKQATLPEWIHAEISPCWVEGRSK